MNRLRTLIARLWAWWIDPSAEYRNGGGWDTYGDGE
jgi:hypothetical protein